jgi:hypothetical protein
LFCCVGVEKSLASLQGCNIIFFLHQWYCIIVGLQEINDWGFFFYVRGITWQFSKQHTSKISHQKKKLFPFLSLANVHWFIFYCEKLFIWFDNNDKLVWVPYSNWMERYNFLFYTTLLICLVTLLLFWCRGITIIIIWWTIGLLCSNYVILKVVAKLVLDVWEFR